MAWYRPKHVRFPISTIKIITPEVTNIDCWTIRIIWNKFFLQKIVENIAVFYMLINNVYLIFYKLSEICISVYVGNRLKFDTLN
jgi:hypothetical protein